eukprot:TRINITY_DN10065_c0_g1_i1.p1 TRINITY_DN10065_c0_g1~~TRINITY_DN10065_c0_g1_i1.p1  ORF type:complete len:852 (+),score=259.07 TRINITY_DN10065_c0_g1_i1:114-2669(+)
MLRRSRQWLRGLVRHVDRGGHDDAGVALARALQNAEFVALDCEFTGIPEREWAATTPQAAYDYVKGFAEEYVLMQVGVSVFRRGSGAMEDEVAAEVFSFVIAPEQETESAKVNPKALQVLAAHGYDFEAWLTRGIPCSDFAATFQQVLDSGLPVVGFHCLLDLVLCFARFVCRADGLPSTPTAFLNILQRRLRRVVDLRQLARGSPAAHHSLARHYRAVCDTSGVPDAVAAHKLAPHEAGVDSYMTGVCYAHGGEAHFAPACTAVDAGRCTYNQLFMYGVPFCFDMARPAHFEGYASSLILSVGAAAREDGGVAVAPPPEETARQLAASPWQLPLTFSNYATPPVEVHWLVYRKRALLVFASPEDKARAHAEYGATRLWVALPSEPPPASTDAAPAPRRRRRRRRVQQAAQKRLLACVRRAHAVLQAAGVSKKERRRQAEAAAAKAAADAAPAAEAEGNVGGMLSRIRAAVGWRGDAPPTPAPPTSLLALKLQAAKGRRKRQPQRLGATLVHAARLLDMEAAKLRRRLRRAKARRAAGALKARAAMGRQAERLRVAQRQVDLLTQGIDGYRAEAEKLRVLLKNATKAMEAQALQQSQERVRPDSVGPPVPKPPAAPMKRHTALRSSARMKPVAYTDKGKDKDKDDKKDERLAALLSARRGGGGNTPSAPVPPPQSVSPKRERNPYMSAGPQLVRPKPTIKYDADANTWRIENYTGPLNVVCILQRKEAQVLVLKNCAKLKVYMEVFGAAVVQDCRAITLLPQHYNAPAAKVWDSVTQIGGTRGDVQFARPFPAGRQEALTLPGGTVVADALSIPGELVVSPPLKKVKYGRDQGQGVFLTAPDMTWHPHGTP